MTKQTGDMGLIRRRFQAIRGSTQGPKIQSSGPRTGPETQSVASYAPSYWNRSFPAGWTGLRAKPNASYSVSPLSLIMLWLRRVRLEGKARMRSSLLAATILLFTATNASAQVEDPVLNALFADSYERPYIDWCREQLPNLQVCSVFDHNQLDEDPLIPACWLVTNGTAKFRCRRDGSVPSALEAIGYIPSTAEEALAVAHLVVADRGQRLLVPANIPRYGSIPPEVASQIADPTITDTEGVFTVDLFTVDYDVEAAEFGEDVSETVDRLTLRVGPEVFQTQWERLVSSPHLEEYREIGLAQKR